MVEMTFHVITLSLNRTGEKQMALELYDLPILLVTCMIRLKYAPLGSRTIIYTVWHNIE